MDEEITHGTVADRLFQQLRRLRKDLVAVRELAECSRERETRKRDQVEITQDLLMTSIFPHEPELRMTFEKIMTYGVLFSRFQHCAY
jgi:hypothetical protein